MGRMIRRNPEEKREIIHLVEHSEMSVSRTLKELDVPRSSFYRWYRNYLKKEKMDCLTSVHGHNSSGTASRKWRVNR